MIAEASTADAAMAVTFLVLIETSNYASDAELNLRYTSEG